jgi:hypothetical protein
LEKSTLDCVTALLAAASSDVTLAQPTGISTSTKTVNAERIGMQL